MTLILGSGRRYIKLNAKGATSDDEADGRAVDANSGWGVTAKTRVGICTT
jgi:hypothetical protein